MIFRGLALNPLGDSRAPSKASCVSQPKFGKSGDAKIAAVFPKGILEPTYVRKIRARRMQSLQRYFWKKADSMQILHFWPRIRAKACFLRVYRRRVGRAWTLSYSCVGVEANAYPRNILHRVCRSPYARQKKVP